jgi:uncharacterized protein (TIGR02453 family)
MTFEGFNPDAIQFFRELGENNNRDWWLANKARYEANVRQPILDLIDALGGDYGTVKTFRPNRDTRFSANKDPYKDQIAFVAYGASGNACYLQLSADRLFLAGGYWQPGKDQLERFRALVDDNKLFGDLDATIDEIAEAGFELSQEGALKTAPRGFDPEHPRINLLRLKSLAISKSIPVQEWFFTKDALGRIRDEWDTVMVWNEWVENNIGATTEPARF